MTGPLPRGSETATPVGDVLEGGGAEALDPGRDLCIVSWNVHKLRHHGIHGELADLVASDQPDLLALQESRADMRIPRGLAGHHARSFRSGLIERSDEGVMTLSRVPPLRAHRIRSSERELFVLTPKAALVSHFPVKGGGELCLVNLHGLNFDPTGGQLARQLVTLAERVQSFDGPLIIAGDFNTWNDSRMAAVDALKDELNLVEAAPDYPGGKTGDLPPGVVSRAVGFNPEMHLDRIFVRGFRAAQVSWMMDYEASDHVPILARLEWT